MEKEKEKETEKASELRAGVRAASPLLSITGVVGRVVSGIGEVTRSSVLGTTASRVRSSARCQMG